MKKLLIIGLIAVLGAVGLVAFFSSRASSQEVSVILASPASLDLYAATGQDDDLVQTGGPLRTINTNETFSLKKGDYLFVPSGSEYDQTPIAMTVGDEAVTKIIDVPYNDQQLGRLLNEQSAAIQKALLATYPKISANYTVQPGKLFSRGEWYGTTIMDKQGPELNVYGDTLRVLMRKDGDNWVVVSRPPSITLSKNSYQDVPEPILQAINKL